MREPSASQLALAKLCGHPFTSGIRAPYEEQSSFGVFGDRVHLACEALISGELVFPAVLAGLGELDVVKLFRCVANAKRLLETTPVMNCVVELDLRYHVDSGKVRRAGDDEKRTKRPGEWTARIDWVGTADGDSILIRDWKTGRQQYTDKAAENPQMRLGAIAAAKHFGARRVRVELVHLDEDDYAIDGADYGPLELATIAHELRELRATLTQGPTPPVPGAHCTTLYCKLRGICAATQAALASAYPLERPLTPVIKDDDQARYTLERLPAAEAALKAIRAAVHEYARKPFPLGDGRIFGWREKEEREVNVATPEREEAVRRVLGHAADFAIRHETTTTLGLLEEAVRIALGDAPARGAKTEKLRAVLAELEACGGLRVSKYEKPEAFKPKEKST